MSSETISMLWHMFIFFYLFHLISTLQFPLSANQFAYQTEQNMDGHNGEHFLNFETNLQKHVTVSSTSNGIIAWPLWPLPCNDIDEYRTLDNAFDAVLFPPPTIVFSTFDVHIIVQKFSVYFFFYLFQFSPTTKKLSKIWSNNDHHREQILKNKKKLVCDHRKYYFIKKNSIPPVCIINRYFE